MTEELEPIEDAAYATCDQCDSTLLIVPGDSTHLIHLGDDVHGYEAKAPDPE